jgi:putative hemolysin
MPLGSGSEINSSYSAQFYGLSPFLQFPDKMMELGRFCIHPDFERDPDILRVAWGALTQYVDRAGVAMLFGCSSFEGVEAEGYRDAFDMLKERHLAPPRWRPIVKATDVLRFGRRPRRAPDAKRALRTMPPLLRSYLMMGGWVSDHAVIDRDLNTLHVFTGLEIAAIPAARKRALRAVAG